MAFAMPYFPSTTLSSWLLFFLMLSASATAQNYVLLGSAIDLGGECFQLTPDEFSQSGAVWCDQPIDLSQKFAFSIALELGCRDELGADGLAFVLAQSGPGLNGSGGSFGYSGISGPTLAVEVDTWMNTTDPIYDHIAIISNGDVNHDVATNLAGPVPARSDEANIEDCELHTLELIWEPSNQSLMVYFDCEWRLTYTSDIIQAIFGGNTQVFWGITSATGGARNPHTVCFLDPSKFNLGEIRLCPGGKIRLPGPPLGISTWSPATYLDDPNAEQPWASPEDDITYLVSTQMGCLLRQDTLDVVIDGTLAGQLNVTDSSVCIGNPITLLVEEASPAHFSWSTGDTTQAITVHSGGAYQVTVTRSDSSCTYSAEAFLTEIPLLTFDLGTDTSLCEGQNLVLKTGIPSAIWQDNSVKDSFLVVRAGLYTALTSNECGIWADQIEVTFDDCESIYLPNAFSPNSDGRNDYYQFLHGGDVNWVKRMAVFDRWGALLFEMLDLQPDDPQLRWDGMRNGRPLPTGVYVLMLDLVFRNGSQQLLTQDILLVK
ncbi:MAG TPA: gliding motility-associated C-terminal domain-containing protein [Saprospiraceae bacterium]|nr:gliding motility-associated C-terminal domain-containing protein [Saprospiraceae bacterium]